MFKVILTNGKDDLSLTFKVRDTPIAIKWFDEITKNYSILENNRFSNWKNNSDYINDLNFHIDVINSYQYLIDKKVSKETNQKDLNYLHKFFEDLRGDIVKGTTWYNLAPRHVKDSVNEFNILIHKLESNIRTNTTHPTIVVTFKDRPIYKLTDQDCKYFTFNWTSGTVYINYCQTGKTILDAFKDNDHLTEGIRPQEYYSADFMIKFGPSTLWAEYILRKIFVVLWIKFKKFKFKNLNLGMIPIADLVTKVDKKNLFNFDKVKEIQCIK